MSLVAGAGTATAESSAAAPVTTGAAVQGAAVAAPIEPTGAAALAAAPAVASEPLAGVAVPAAVPVLWGAAVAACSSLSEAVAAPSAVPVSLGAGRTASHEPLEKASTATSTVPSDGARGAAVGELPAEARPWVAVPAAGSDAPATEGPTTAAMVHAAQAGRGAAALAAAAERGERAGSHTATWVHLPDMDATPSAALDGKAAPSDYFLTRDIARVAGAQWFHMPDTDLASTLPSCWASEQERPSPCPSPGSEKQMGTTSSPRTSELPVEATASLWFADIASLAPATLQPRIAATTSAWFDDAADLPSPWPTVRADDAGPLPISSRLPGAANKEPPVAPAPSLSVAGNEQPQVAAPTPVPGVADEPQLGAAAAKVNGQPVVRGLVAAASTIRLCIAPPPPPSFSLTLGVASHGAVQVVCTSRTPLPTPRSVEEGRVRLIHVPPPLEQRGDSWQGGECEMLLNAFSDRELIRTNSWVASFASGCTSSRRISNGYASEMTSARLSSGSNAPRSGRIRMLLSSSAVVPEARAGLGQNRRESYEAEDEAAWWQTSGDVFSQMVFMLGVMPDLFMCSSCAVAPCVTSEQLATAMASEEASANVATEARLLSATAMRVPLVGLRAAAEAAPPPAAAAAPAPTPPRVAAARAPGEALPRASPSTVVAPPRQQPIVLPRAACALPERGPSGDWAADAAEELLAKKVDPFGEDDDEGFSEDVALLGSCARSAKSPPGWCSASLLSTIS